MRMIHRRSMACMDRGTSGFGRFHLLRRGAGGNGPTREHWRAESGRRIASPRSGAVDWAGQTAGAYGFTFGSPAGSVFVGCEMAGGSEDGNESSSDLSSSLSISSWLLYAVCPCPPSSRCRSFPPSRLVVPPWFAAIALTPLALVAEVSLSRAPHCNCAWSEGFQKPTACDLKAAEPCLCRNSDTTPAEAG